MHYSKYKNPFIYSIFFTFISLAIHRYSYGIGDQAIHIPLIQKAIDPNLYPNDLLFTAGQGKLSLFYIWSGYLINYIKLDIATYFFLGYICFIFLFFLALFFLGRFFFGSKYWSAVFFAVFFLVPLQVGGTATYTFEISFVPRLIAFVFSLYALYFTLVKKYFFVLLVLSLIFAIHPISFFYIFFILFMIVIISKSYPSALNLILFIVVFLTINFPLISNMDYKLRNYSILNESSKWIEILRERNFYVFLELWNVRAWINLLLITLPTIYYIFFYKKAQRKLLTLSKIIFIASVLATLVQFLFTTLWPLTNIIQLQLSRIWVFSYLSSALSLAAILSSLKVNIKRLSVFLIFILLLLSPFYHKKWYYTQNISWIKTQKWVNSNTGKSCLFLTPFKHQGFRVYARRATVAEFKDGTLSFYSQQFAREWDERSRNISNWETSSVDQLKNLQNKYNFSYLVTLSERIIPLESVYNDGIYVVYRMPDIKYDCEMKSLAKEL